MLGSLKIFHCGGGFLYLPPAIFVIKQFLNALGNSNGHFGLLLMSKTFICSRTSGTLLLKSHGYMSIPEHCSQGFTYRNSWRQNKSYILSFFAKAEMSRIILNHLCEGFVFTVLIVTLLTETKVNKPGWNEIGALKWWNQELQCAQNLLRGWETTQRSTVGEKRRTPCLSIAWCSTPRLPGRRKKAS